MTETKKKKKREEGHDKVAKVRPLISALNKQFAEHYRPSTHQSVDESMIAFKGRSALKQYTPIKHLQERVHSVVPCRLKLDILFNFKSMKEKNQDDLPI